MIFIQKRSLQLNEKVMAMNFEVYLNSVWEKNCRKNVRSDRPSCDNFELFDKGLKRD